MLFSEKVRYVRGKLGLTQSELAKQSGIPEPTLIKWENEKDVKPKAINFAKFLDYCESKGIRFENDEVKFYG